MSDLVATASTASEEDDDRDRAVPRAFLFLIIDADFPLAGGGRFSLDNIGEVVLLGRRRERSVVREERDGRRVLELRLKSLRASELHARLARTTGGWMLEDAGSKNGTYLNEERIGSRARVRPGDIVRVGHVYLTISEQVLSHGFELADDVVDVAELGPQPLPGFPTMDPNLAAELAAMRGAFASTHPITIVGETGTGKEELARAIHNASGRQGPFKAVNCAAIPPTLAEGQLFGYLKGAYSGAERADPGHIRLAEGGTLLLDEIPDLPLEIQAKLLRVLEAKEVVPLGTARGIRVDVRYLVATQRPLDDLVAEGRFRADLKARLDPLAIELPPLRERREDLGLLIATLLRRLGASETVRIPPQAMQHILSSDWPENIRQLERLLGASLLRTSNDALDPAIFAHASSGKKGVAQKVVLAAKDLEARSALIALFKKHRGNATAVAREMGRSRQQVYRMVQRFGLDPDAFRAQPPIDSDEPSR